ncbi:MAG: hypothetical protein ABR947_05945 [Solirubrobacteraceae bacterium]|jgi:hypothetical protein
MSDSVMADLTATCAGIAIALAIGAISGIWVVGIVIGVAVGAVVSDKMRVRAGLPERGLIQPNNRKRNRRD